MSHHFVKSNTKGQSLIEFLFLFIAIIFLSLATLKITNGNLAKKWAGIVGIISSPNPDKIQIPEIY